jgi:two-component system, NtrC family, sensor histidine kinase PilS
MPLYAPDLATSTVFGTSFSRLWKGFMTARILIAAVIFILQFVLMGLGQTVSVWLFVLSTAYLMIAIATRWLARPPRAGQRLTTVQWPWTVGVDILVFAGLHFLQAGGLNYTPLFALPILFVAVMGSRLLALGTAAGVTLLLLSEAWWYSFTTLGEPTPRFFQSGLVGIGLLTVAFLANQLAGRLAREERLARFSQQAARSQVQVNELVIEAMSDGVLVVDVNGMVRSANPAARRFLGAQAMNKLVPFLLSGEKAWQPLLSVVQNTLSGRDALVCDLNMEHLGEAPRPLHVRASITRTSGADADRLCVLFMEDLREMQARIRTEKLAAMGRMSAAVAHEIRNPLAAISQANALLEEDLQDPAHKKMTKMVRQNAQRLDRIVEEILNLARPQERNLGEAKPLHLNKVVQSIAFDWADQNKQSSRLGLELRAETASVQFDHGHLRQVLVNLLDNAARYASQSQAAIVVRTYVQSDAVILGVWSDGKPLESTVREHLFEPFFSSESRSSGLGLYICRELCERHRAALAYRRSEQHGNLGNEFFITMPMHADAYYSSFQESAL